VSAPIAVCLIRDLPHYRREAFVSGLWKVGKRVVASAALPGSKDDWLVIWNRYGENERQADIWEHRGGTVVVAENGYIGADAEGRQLYAIAIHGHNGSGRWHVGEEDRFGALGISVAPWRTGGDYVLVCGQRGIGTRQMASPANWHIHAATRLKGKFTTKIRLHPGRHEAIVPLDDDLAGAQGVAVWSSSSGVKALLKGIPVMYDAPYWVASDGATRLESCEFKRSDEDRAKALHRAAWAQWTVEEIASGLPFEYLTGVQ
jgi:hypothetical protein